MLSDILFSLDRVMPYFLLIVLGLVLRKSGLVSRGFFAGANSFTFRVALPFQLFFNIINIEKGAGEVGLFLGYVLLVTLLSFGIIWAVTEVVYRDNKALIGTLVQGAFRGNFVLLGVPLAGAVLGAPASQLAALASVVTIPAYNILAVIVLSARGKGSEQPTVSGVLHGIVTNPLIIGILSAIPFLLFGLRLPQMVQSTVNYVGMAATPLGLLSIGGLLHFADATARLRPALYAVFIKNLILPLAIMLASYHLGFRGAELLILLVLSATPVAVGSYAMASEMGGDAALASNILILSTFVSGFILAFGIYLLKAFALI